MKNKEQRKDGVSETIILAQSIMLIAFGLASYSASSTIVAAMKVLTEKESFVAFVTDDKVITENTEITTTQAISIINNFELVCITALTIGIIVASASVARLYLKSPLNKRNKRSTSLKKQLNV